MLTEESRAANFTNERGVDGTIRYLRNVMGLWLLSETLRTWELLGATVSLSGLIAMAADVPPGGPIFDPDAPQFLPPGDMPARIADALQGHRAAPRRQTRPRSSAASWTASQSPSRRESLMPSGFPGSAIEVIHIVGGGSQNRLLCQLVADAAGLPVIAGPVEATALGNLLVQGRTHGALTGDLWDLRAQLRGTTQTRVFQPHATDVPALDRG